MQRTCHFRRPGDGNAISLIDRGGLGGGEVGGYYGRAAGVDGGERFFEDGGEVGRVGDGRGEGAAGGGGDAGEVGFRFEGDAEVVGREGGAVRVDAQGGLLGGAPAAVVVDDGERRQLVAAGHPVDHAGHDEQVAAVTRQGNHGPFGKSDFRPQQTAA